MEQTCRGCDAILTPMKRRGRPKLWCSQACRAKATRRRRTPSDVPCARCGELMQKPKLPAGQAVCRVCRNQHGGIREATWKPQSLICPVCSMGFVQDWHHQKYCTPMCRARRRQSWKPHTRTTSQRGYGPTHQRERRKWVPIVEAGQAVCSLCEQPIVPGTPWHLDHSEDRTAYRGVAHAICNLREGGRLKHRRARELRASRRAA